MGKRIRKLGLKITLLFILFALILCLAISVYSYFTSFRAYSDFYSSKAQETAALAATLVDGDRVAYYLQTGVTDEYYNWLQETFNNIKHEQNVMYLYIFAPELDRFTYILEAMLETDDPALLASLGDVYMYTDLELKCLVPDVIAAKPSTEKIMVYTDIGYGRGMTAWAPIFNSGGELVAMVEADLSLDLVYSMLRQYTATIMVFSCAIILLMVITLAMFNHRLFTRPLTRLTKSALDFASGDTLTYVSDIKTGDEMQALSEALSKMSLDIDHYTKRLAHIAADEERIATELDIAKDIKKSLLPTPLTNRDDFTISASLESAREAGGNFYDFFFIDPAHFCLVLADVSGKGIPAAIYTIVAKTMIKNQLMAGLPVDQSMSILNSRFYESGVNHMTVAAFVGVLEIATGKCSVVNAGQNTPLLMKSGGSYEFHREQAAPALAESQNVVYRKMDLNLRQGDTLFLYTDGVMNRINTEGAAFGTEQLHSLVNRSDNKACAPEELLRRTHNELTLYAAGMEQSGDVAMLLLRYDKGDKAQAEITVPSRADCFLQVLAFIKRQLAENDLGGVFYAGVAVTLEELFVLVAGRSAASINITVRCNVYDEYVEIRMIYGGRHEDPRDTTDKKELDALAFVEKHTNKLSYEVQEGKNVLMMVKKIIP